MTLESRDFAAYSRLARGLPHLRPRVTQALLRELRAQAAAAGSVEVAGLRVLAADLDELHVRIVRDGFPGTVVSPAGAALLVRLYRAGVLDTGGQAPGEPAADLLAYTRGEGPWTVRAVAGDIAAHVARLADPAGLAEADFTPRVLDDLFRRHLGRGEGQLRIGGLLVRRSVGKSFEGGTLRFHVAFEWVTADGEVRRTGVSSGHSGIWARPDQGLAP